MLIKFEADVRQHIRVEQQLKLHIEQMQLQTEELIKENSKKQLENDRLMKLLDEKKGKYSIVEEIHSYK